MASVNIYLNFPGTALEAFTHYKSVFNSEFDSPPMRMGDLPPQPGAPEMSESDKQKIMHISLPILNGTKLQATDALESMGHSVTIGNNTTISLELDSREDADRIYAALSEGATDCAPLTEQFWGYWGTMLDRFGVRWMFNVMNPMPA